MKTIFKSLLLSLVTTTFFTSCTKKVEPSKYEDGYYLAVATIAQSEDGDNYLKEDDGVTSYPTNLQNLNDSVNDSIIGKRSWFEYRTFKKEYAEEGYDKTIELLNFYPTVWTKKYKVANDSSELIPFGEEIVDIKYAWVSGNYLNLGYQFEASDIEKHDFDLVRTPYNDKDGKISFKFCHIETDNGSDKGYFIISSFDVSDLLPTATNKKVTFDISYQISPEKTVTIPYVINASEVKAMNIAAEKM